MGRVEGKTAMVTGGGRGIGRGIVLELAKEGADIVIADIDQESATKTAAEVRDMGRQCSVVEVDVTDAESVRAGVEQAIAQRGRVDILVNNAGVLGQHYGGDAIMPSDFDMCYEVNLKGMWTMSSALVPHFRANESGKIVNIASIAGRHGRADIPHYAASKAGAISLTQSMALDLARSNVNVNAVCPGRLWTNMWRQLEAMAAGDDTPEVVERRRTFEMMLERDAPLGREQTPQDVGRAVAFLASEDARNITGQSLNVDGGIEMD